MAESRPAPQPDLGPRPRDGRLPEVHRAYRLPGLLLRPRSPRQRGTNENTNGLLRQYLAKTGDLRAFDQAALDAIAIRLNDRPREVLGWRITAEVFAACRPF